MYVDEEVFRHEALDTETLDYLVDQKNRIYSCNSNEDITYPWTSGVYPADEVPSAFFAHDTYHMNWISNTDPAEKAGQHWVCIFHDKEIIAESHDIILECEKNTFSIIDLWGGNENNTTCENITTITDATNVSLKEHLEHMKNCKLNCECVFEIHFPVKKRIQYSSYENCGWFALYFSTKTLSELKNWWKSSHNNYGQITHNYNSMVSYFKQFFFPA